MKKTFFGLVFIFCAFNGYSQTWTEVRQVWGGITFHREITVLTSEQFNRLRQQFGETTSFVNITYVDVLERGTLPRVISGTRPNFTGFYLLLIREETLAGIVNILAYGHPNTGRMEVRYNPFGGISVGSAEYTRLRNQFIRWVNGE